MFCKKCLRDVDLKLTVKPLNENYPKGYLNYTIYRLKGCPERELHKSDVHPGASDVLSILSSEGHPIDDSDYHIKSAEYHIKCTASVEKIKEYIEDMKNNE